MRPSAHCIGLLGRNISKKKYHVFIKTMCGKLYFDLKDVKSSAVNGCGNSEAMRKVRSKDVRLDML